ncbi:MAG TPA: DEAD/DEAH box helicase family protein [Clostridia bacterium]|nr:DEAD/DEAH box helicase family protein [Clostridia bacterium]
MGFRWLFLDLETTGLDDQVDHILEVATITSQHKGEREVWETLVNPGVAVPPHITFLTGINETMLAKAPTSEEVATQLRALLTGKVIVAHNAPFDLGFLEALVGSLPNQWIDTLQLTKIIFPSLPSYSLRYLVKRFSLTSSPDHRAYADTLAVEELFFYLQEEAYHLSLQEIQNIYYFLQDEEQGLSLFFEKILQEKIKKFDFNQSLRVPQIEQEEEKDDFASEPLTWVPEELVKMFSAQGSIAQGFTAYEQRAEQIKMMKAVAKAFSQKRFLVVEAGTGVGKSLAYLVPALAWAVSQREKVVVATHTIALQEQLWRSDIRFLQQNLPFKFKATVLKGRNNYFCLQEWQNLQKNIAALSWSEKVFMARLGYWLVREKTGDKDTITLRGWETEMFAQLSSSKENCLGGQCPFFHDCFYQKAKKKAQTANLIIVNHSLLLSDVKIGDALLPEYHHLIIDEAHHLEDEGTKQFTETFSLRDLQKKVNQLRKKNYLRLPSEVLPEVKQLIADLNKCSRDIEQKSDLIWQNISTLPDKMIRIKKQVYAQKWWENLKVLFENLFASGMELSHVLTRLYHQLEGDWADIIEEKVLQNLWVYIGELKAALELEERFFHTLEEGSVYWLETKTKPRDFLLQITPLNIANLYREFLFSNLTTAVLTSATLSVAEDFDFLMQRIGLPRELVDTLQIPSPFLYEEQSLLLIDNSLPDPARTPEEEYNLALKEALYKILQATGGRTLVLFTSHQQLQNIYYSLKTSLQEKGLELYADKIDGRRHVLLTELKNNPAAIVFGANTFWEGIDLPGSSLTAVLMIRLPFWPPHHPLVEARVEAMEQEGKNGFFNYSLPQAVLRFRQGYGRLIRTIDDWGVVIVLDNRLLKKRYGKVFLRSLPQQNYLAGSTEQIIVKINNWFKNWNQDS